VGSPAWITLWDVTPRNNAKAWIESTDVNKHSTEEIKKVLHRQFNRPRTNESAN
jgi:hypothetical protein